MWELWKSIIVFTIHLTSTIWQDFLAFAILVKQILTFPPHSILSIQTFKIDLKIRNFFQKVTYDVTHANTETAGSKTSLEKKLNCMVKPPLASRPTEAVKFVEAVVVRLVALILLSRTEENLFEVVPRLFDEFFFQTLLSASTSTWHTDKVFSKRLACLLCLCLPDLVLS